MKAIITDTKGNPLLIDPEEIKAISVHTTEDYGTHDNCGTLILKGRDGDSFHIANAAAVINQFLPEHGEASK